MLVEEAKAVEEVPPVAVPVVEAEAVDEEVGVALTGSIMAMARQVRELPVPAAANDVTRSRNNSITSLAHSTREAERARGRRRLLTLAQVKLELAAAVVVVVVEKAVLVIAEARARRAAEVANKDRENRRCRRIRKLSQSRRTWATCSWARKAAMETTSTEEVQMPIRPEDNKENSGRKSLNSNITKLRKAAKRREPLRATKGLLTLPKMKAPLVVQEVEPEEQPQAVLAQRTSERTREPKTAEAITMEKGTATSNSNNSRIAATKTNSSRRGRIIANYNTMTENIMDSPAPAKITNATRTSTDAARGTGIIKARRQKTMITCLRVFVIAKVGTASNNKTSKPAEEEVLASTVEELAAAVADDTREETLPYIITSKEVGKKLRHPAEHRPLTTTGRGPMRTGQSERCAAAQAPPVPRRHLRVGEASVPAKAGATDTSERAVLVEEIVSVADRILARRLPSQAVELTSSLGPNNLCRRDSNAPKREIAESEMTIIASVESLSQIACGDPVATLSHLAVRASIITNRALPSLFSIVAGTTSGGIGPTNSPFLRILPWTRESATGTWRWRKRRRGWKCAGRP